MIDLKTTTCEKDLGVHVDSLLNFEDHMAKQSKQARGVAAMIFKYIVSRQSEIPIPPSTPLP